jgi:hypothetical protein
VDICALGDLFRKERGGRPNPLRRSRSEVLTPEAERAMAEAEQRRAANADRVD